MNKTHSKVKLKFGEKEKYVFALTWWYRQNGSQRSLEFVGENVFSFSLKLK